MLRVLETGEFIKVGDRKTTKVNVRIIAATNKNLAEEVKERKFREHLFYRLTVFTIGLPPLRERKEDIALLAEYYTKFFANKTNRKITGVNKEAVKLLQMHQWKGNIREMKNIIERAVILENTYEITPHALPFDIQNSVSPSADALDMAAMENSISKKCCHLSKATKQKRHP